MPANTIESNWDALKTIINTIHELEADGIKASRKWAQGHQDKNIRCSELPMEAQMNCNADLEVCRHQRAEGAVRDKVF